VELAQRLCENGLVTRSQDNEDQRRVLLQLTGLAEERLADLSHVHVDELARIKPMLERVLAQYP
jgi:DNA-binding MarR family transcriptional regulator